MDAHQPVVSIQPEIDAILASGVPPVSLSDAILAAKNYLHPRLTSRFPTASVEITCSEGFNEDLEPTGNLIIVCTCSPHPQMPGTYDNGAEWGKQALPALDAFLPKIEEAFAHGIESLITNKRVSDSSSIRHH